MTLVLPDITDSTISNVCRVLDLPETAFSGIEGQDPRLPVLKSLATSDIEACPGSGKTTLLVAKLAILGKLWSDRGRGLCVLSHTNVARREIEQRLGNTAEGRRLLSHPHFIGTIHGFVNEFLAIPWMRSIGYPIEMIDDEVTLHRRWRKLPYRIRGGLENNRHDERILRIQDPLFDVGEIRWGNGGTLGKESPTYLELVAACRKSAQEGYFCHDEMFVWAHDLIDKVPEVTAILRDRFPLLFIDEVQDNSETQASLLHRVFMEGDGAVRRQRYGDSNQAIYQNAGQQGGAVSDRFPVAADRADIPNSFRFGQEIADFADPLALVPPGLRGKGQAEGSVQADTTGKHAVFLFDEDTIAYVFETYAAYLVELFSEKELEEGLFTAIGAVHQPNGDDNLPRHIGHYWPAYDHAISRADPQPQSFVQYVNAGRCASEKSGEAHAAVEKIAEALLRLARIADPAFSSGTRKLRHRQVLELLTEKHDERSIYLGIIRSLAVERVTLTEAEWNARWRPDITRVVEAITGATVNGPDVEDFLASQALVDGALDNEQNQPSDNIFRYPRESPNVAIRIGSIHAAKGETHTATLVLETFYRTHHLKTLKPWLLGDRNGGSGENATLQSRLKLHYVAMTRPARLLCLALREDSLSVAEIAKLIARGWRVARVKAGAPEWLERAAEPG